MSIPAPTSNVRPEKYLYVVQSTLDSLTLKIQASLARRQEGLREVQASSRGGFPRNLPWTIVPRDWQISAARELLERRDSFVVTGTGSGKSLCYQLALVTSPGKCILAIFPLISLMTDQVDAAERLEIKACKITHSTLSDDQGLLRDVAQAKYELICSSPEWAVPENKQFSSMLNSPQLRESLIGIVVDESHLCFIWNEFRPLYGRLGTLRVLVPNIPIMALSATMSPNVLRYAQSALRMNRPTGLIKRSIDRPNIFLVCLLIEHPIATRKDLEYILPLHMSGQEVRAIPKTIIFVDSRALVCAMTTAMITRLQPQFRGADIICDYSTALSEARRKDVMEMFMEGGCRILICTEAAGMGVDVPDVSRVIQWTVSRQLNISNFWQRAGRCGRNRNLRGVAILFYNKSQRVQDLATSSDADGPEPLSLYCEPAYGLRSELTLRNIRGFESANPELEVADPQPVENGDHYSGQEQSAPRRNPPPPAQFPSALKHIDKGLLWFLSTTGCRRAVVRQYFEDTDFSPFCDSPNTGGQDNVLATTELSCPLPCCDNCSNLTGLQPDAAHHAGMLSLLPPCYLPGREETVTRSLSEDEGGVEVQRSRAISHDLRQTLKANLERFRIEVWAEEGLNQCGGFFGPELILQDKVIATLVQKARSVHDMESLRKTLERNSVNLRFALIEPHAQKLIEVILATLLVVEPPTEEENYAPSNSLLRHDGELREPMTPAQPAPIPTGQQIIRTRGRPTAALRAEQARLEGEIARVAQERMADAVARGESGMRWDMSLLGKRSRGRPTAEMQEARRQAELSRADIMESLVTEVAFPLSWARKIGGTQ